MKYISYEERKKEIENSVQFSINLLKDINSDESYSNKKYLQKFNKMIKINVKNDMCECDEPKGYEFYTNYHNPNNVIITNISYTNNDCNSSHSPF